MSKSYDKLIQRVVEREPYVDTDSRVAKRRLLKVFRRKPPEARRTGGQLVIHRYKKAAPKLLEMISSGELEGVVKGSDLSDLAIVTIHNYDEKTIFEQSLDFLGVKDYTVLKHSGEWSMCFKYLYLLEFLEECEKPYVLCCDARDTIFTDDPVKILPLFKEFKCEALFNSTMSPRGIFKSYKWTEPLFWWSRHVSKTTWRKRHANAGAFIGKTQFIKEICEVVSFYCERIGCKRYPHSDQDVLRGIYPWFWPRMTLDYYNKIFYRN